MVDVRERDADDKGDAATDDVGEEGVEKTGGIEHGSDDNGGSLNI